MFRRKGGNLPPLAFTEMERHQPGGRLNSLAKDAASEPPRVSRRLYSLRGWGHGETRQVFPGGAGASLGPRVAVGGDHLDRREDRVCGRDGAELGAAGRA